MTRLSPVPRARLGSAAWLRWPRRTARLRFTVLYGGLFLVSGAALVAVTYALFERATEYRAPQLPRIPHTPAIQNLKEQLAPAGFALAKALPQLARDQYQLGQAQQQLAQNLKPLANNLTPPSNPFPLTVSVPRLAQDERRLAQDQHQLAAVQRQLAQAVHQVAQAGPAEAAQRAAD